jgi:ankyrin repeat protein
LAVKNHQNQAVQYLLKANANPLLKDGRGNTPLHLACRNSYVQETQALLSRTNHVNPHGIPEIDLTNYQG